MRTSIRRSALSIIAIVATATMIAACGSSGSASGSSGNSTPGSSQESQSEASGGGSGQAAESTGGESSGTSAASGESGAGSSEETGSGSGELTTITLGYHPDMHAAGLVVVGNEQGFWKQVGLKVESKEFSDGPTEIQALAGGDIQFGYIGPGATWMAASGKATLVTVDSFSNGDYVIARPGIDSLKDLKGKKVGYVQGTSSEMILRLALRKAGLTMDDIQGVQLTPDAVAPAFVTKQIDVAAIWVPLSQTIKDKVPEAKFLAVDNDFSPKYAFPQSWIAANDVVKNNPNLVKKFLKGFALANDYRMQHIDDAVTATSAVIHVPEDALKAQADATKWMSSADLAKAYQDGTAAGWFNKMQALFKSMGELDAVQDPSNFTAFDLFPSTS